MEVATVNKGFNPWTRWLKYIAQKRLRNNNLCLINNTTTNSNNDPPHFFHLHLKSLKSFLVLFFGRRNVIDISKISNMPRQVSRRDNLTMEIDWIVWRHRKVKTLPEPHLPIHHDSSETRFEPKLISPRQRGLKSLDFEAVRKTFRHPPIPMRTKTVTLNLLICRWTRKI